MHCISLTMIDSQQDGGKQCILDGHGQRSKLGFYIPFNSQGHIGTGSKHCHLWDSNHTEMTACG